LNQNSKTKIEILLYFWDLLIKENDQIFIHFFIISFLEYHQDIISSADFSQIPSIISQLILKDHEMVNTIFLRAKIIRSATPYSFRLFFQKLEIFNPNSNKHKELNETFQPELLLALPILPCEIFYVAYNKIVTCPDKNCFNFKNLFDYEKNNLITSEISNNGNSRKEKFFEDEDNNNSGNGHNSVNKENLIDIKDENILLSSIRSLNTGI
jgi:hypothetical protein